MSGVLLLAVGNRSRGDDALGPRVLPLLAQRLPAGVRVLEHSGEPSGLIELLGSASSCLLVDALATGGPPGRLLRWDAHAGSLAGSLHQSSHSLGVAEAIELARALGRLPERLVVLGLEGQRYDLGAPLSPPVAAALPELASAIAQELEAWREEACTNGA